MNDLDTISPIVVHRAGMESVPVLRDLDYGGGDPSLRMDVYRPIGVGPWPVVLFVHGEAEPEQLATAKDWGQYTSWARLVATAGMVGVTFTHRSWEALRQVRHKLLDVEAAVRAVRTHGRSWGADPARLCLFAISAGVPVGVSTAIRQAATCAVAYYGPMDVRPYGDAGVLAEVSPKALLESGRHTIPPLLVARAGKDDEALNQSIDDFVNAAWELELPVLLEDHEEGSHAFDVVDDDARAREIVHRTIAFMTEHLRP